MVRLRDATSSRAWPQQRCASMNSVSCRARMHNAHWPLPQPMFLCMPFLQLHTIAGTTVCRISAHTCAGIDSQHPYRSPSRGASPPDHASTSPELDANASQHSSLADQDASQRMCLAGDDSSQRTGTGDPSQRTPPRGRDLAENDDSPPASPVDREHGDQHAMDFVDADMSDNSSSDSDV